MKDKKRIIVIGGSAAGPKAAAKARRLDEEAEIVIIQKAPDLSMASCGYPYYVGGFFDDRNLLICTPTGVVRDPKFYLNAKGIVARTETEATSIDPKAKAVTVRDLKSGKDEMLSYDKLILATGAVPRIPPIPGAGLSGITTLQSMQDADYLRRIRDEKKIKKAVIIGGGLIGIETCEALQLAGIEITVIEMLPQLLTFLDWELAKLVENHVRSKDANVITDNGIAEFLGEDGRLTGVKLQNGIELPCELAVVAIGVNPNSRLAREAGLEIGATGGIAVNEFMQTSDPDIYAAGDCVESLNLITGKKVHAPYGDLANLQGRVAGENAAAGNSATFPGTIQTGICKVFDFAAGSTGLSEKAASAQGYTDIETVINASPDKPGFMTGLLLVTKLVVERSNGRILGAQCVGPGDVSKQLATWAMAIKGRLTVDDMINADLPYAPPFSLAIDHSIATAHIMQNKLKGRMKGVSCSDLKKRLDGGAAPFILDARGPDEYEQMRLGVGERLIPIGALRNRLNELPEDKNAEIICYCKISLRGYEAARVLEGRGWKNVKVMEGGIAAWPFPREK
ncbi:MAG TPA: FAD-dependent oxidoreductase [Spirochaetota bacterium]|nr:MAG: NADH peroxidase [Spirochaetes bacterium ADurb.BinA120]HNU91767.1 FAD-dependent oxidoreductase [Spirochaetota bacterium]HPO46304.1 FAD-dependent oxidoreductase [Spirochaetota bacterium]